MTATHTQVLNFQALLRAKKQKWHQEHSPMAITKMDLLASKLVVRPGPRVWYSNMSTQRIPYLFSVRDMITINPSKKKENIQDLLYCKTVLFGLNTVWQTFSFLSWHDLLMSSK